MARPSEYNFEMCKVICSEVAGGFNIKTILKSKDEYDNALIEFYHKHKDLVDKAN